MGYIRPGDRDIYGGVLCIFSLNTYSGYSLVRELGTMARGAYICFWRQRGSRGWNNKGRFYRVQPEETYQTV